MFGFQQHMKKSGHCSQAEMPPLRGKGWGCICPTTRYFSSKTGLDLLQLSISSKHLLHFSPLFVNHIHQIYCCQVDSKRYLPPKGPLQLKAKQAPDNPQETLWDLNVPAVYQVRITRGDLKAEHQGAQSNQVQLTGASLLFCLKWEQFVQTLKT